VARLASAVPVESSRSEIEQMMMSCVTFFDLPSIIIGEWNRHRFLRLQIIESLRCDLHASKDDCFVESATD
jgi:hypothetical protein